jgi:hypothetical protein
MSPNIGFISTRFAGTDGVTLESGKWAEVLEAAGHRCFWLAGELDREPATSILEEKAHFRHPRNVMINAQVFGRKKRKAAITDLIHELRSNLKDRLCEFIKRFDLDYRACGDQFRCQRRAGASTGYFVDHHSQRSRFSQPANRRSSAYTGIQTFDQPGIRGPHYFAADQDRQA